MSIKLNELYEFSQTLSPTDQKLFDRWIGKFQDWLEDKNSTYKVVSIDGQVMANYCSLNTMRTDLPKYTDQYTVVRIYQDKKNIVGVIKECHYTELK